MNQPDRPVILKNRIDHILSLEHHLGIFLLEFSSIHSINETVQFSHKNQCRFYILLLHKFDKDINKFISDNIRKFYH